MTPAVASITPGNDPVKTTKKDPGHDDFRWTATVHRTALGGPDAHSADDVCPRPTLPGGIDPNPTPAKPIKDRGCGGKLPDKTLGAAVAHRSDIPRERSLVDRGCRVVCRRRIA